MRGWRMGRGRRRRGRGGWRRVLEPETRRPAFIYHPQQPRTNEPATHIHVSIIIHTRTRICTHHILIPRPRGPDKTRPRGPDRTRPPLEPARRRWAWSASVPFVPRSPRSVRTAYLRINHIGINRHPHSHPPAPAYPTPPSFQARSLRAQRRRVGPSCTRARARVPCGCVLFRPPVCVCVISARKHANERTLESVWRRRPRDLGLHPTPTRSPLLSSHDLPYLLILYPALPWLSIRPSVLRSAPARV
jgi:hypothetical protein